jgi:hypothetical protein
LPLSKQKLRSVFLKMKFTRTYLEYSIPVLVNYVLTHCCVKLCRLERAWQPLLHSLLQTSGTLFLRTAGRRTHGGPWAISPVTLPSSSDWQLAHISQTAGLPLNLDHLPNPRGLQAYMPALSRIAPVTILKLVNNALQERCTGLDSYLMQSCRAGWCGPFTGLLRAPCSGHSSGSATPGTPSSPCLISFPHPEV